MAQAISAVGMTLGILAIGYAVYQLGRIKWQEEMLDSIRETVAAAEQRLRERTREQADRQARERED